MSERDEIIEPERRPHWCSVCRGFNDTPASPCYVEPEDEEAVEVPGSPDINGLTSEPAPGVATGQPAHSKSEYKRRVAQGDPNILPPAQQWLEAAKEAQAGFADALTSGVGGKHGD